MELSELDPFAEQQKELYKKCRINNLPPEKHQGYDNEAAYIHFLNLAMVMEIDEGLAKEFGLDINRIKDVERHTGPLRCIMDASYFDFFLANTFACRMECHYCQKYVKSLDGWFDHDCVMFLESFITLMNIVRMLRFSTR